MEAQDDIFNELIDALRAAIPYINPHGYEGMPSAQLECDITKKRADAVVEKASRIRKDEE